MNSDENEVKRLAQNLREIDAVLDALHSTAGKLVNELGKLKQKRAEQVCPRCHSTMRKLRLRVVGPDSLPCLHEWHNESKPTSSANRPLLVGEQIIVDGVTAGTGSRYIGTYGYIVQISPNDFGFVATYSEKIPAIWQYYKQGKTTSFTFPISPGFRVRRTTEEEKEKYYRLIEFQQSLDDQIKKHNEKINEKKGDVRTPAVQFIQLLEHVGGWYAGTVALLVNDVTTFIIGKNRFPVPIGQSQFRYLPSDYVCDPKYPPAGA